MIPVSDLTVETTEANAETVVTIAGRVTIDSSPRLRTALLDVIRGRRSPVVAINASAVEYLDTSGMATLLEASRIARDQSVRLRLFGLTGEPKMLADVAELSEIFNALGSSVEGR